MFTISLCMIVRDEEESIGRCLSTVCDLVDEIIIVDTGSTDRTKEIALTYGAKLFDFTWEDDFSAARNYAFAQAKMTYIFWLDADDVLLEADRQGLAALKAMDPFDYDSVSMPYQLKVDERGEPVHSLRRNRLVRRTSNFIWHGAVHEFLAVTGKILHSEIAITHQKLKPYTDQNLQIYLKRKEKGDVFDPRDQFYFANELFDHARYEEAALQYELFLDEGLGWIEDQILACSKQAECYAYLKQPEKQIQSLTRALAIDLPRAEICCRMGAFFEEKLDFLKAIYWYRQATLLERPQSSMAKVDESAWTWLPHLQLCYCYDRIGEKRKAKIHHDMAKLYYPTHPSVLYNEAYFASLKELDAVEQSMELR
ncbi:glycosyltransferase [Brevibacillus sp. 179-C9.3 HS]|uniref:glycosyltransferase n=1 Tax=unclassified Brevibacillus TaxID=2684853 RepID=UPI00399EF871